MFGRQRVANKSGMARKAPESISKINKRRVAIIILLPVVLAACTTTTNPFTREDQTSKTSTGAGIGAASGVAIGAIAGGSRKSVLLGLGIGALIGAAIGRHMDNEEAKLRQHLEETGVSVTRDGDSIILNMPSNVTFALNSSDLSAEFFKVLDSVALVLKEFQQTYIDVVGHTDKTGALELNMRLSEQRANTVASYLKSRGVTSERFLVTGKGPTQPLVSNDTEDGRAANRRVEIKLTPIT